MAALVNNTIRGFPSNSASPTDTFTINYANPITIPMHEKNVSNNVRRIGRVRWAPPYQQSSTNRSTTNTT